jgi:hypothetical protein
MKITFYNTTRKDKTTDEFVNNPAYIAGGGGKTNFAESDLLKIINASIPDKMDLYPAQDIELHKEEIQKVKQAVAQKINSLLEVEGREVLTKGSHTIFFEGKEVKLDIRPAGPNPLDFQLHTIYYRIYEICNECLEENKPMYLSLLDEPRN